MMKTCFARSRPHFFFGDISPRIAAPTFPNSPGFPVAFFGSAAALFPSAPATAHLWRLPPLSSSSFASRKAAFDAFVWSFAVAHFLLRLCSRPAQSATGITRNAAYFAAVPVRCYNMRSWGQSCGDLLANAAQHGA